MQPIDLEPRIVFSFTPDSGLSASLLKHVLTKGWEGIHRVPVFEIPPDLRRDGYEYVLADGMYRYEVALFAKQLLPCMLYGPDEKIDPVKDGIAPFRHSNDPKIYEKLITWFVHYDKLHAAMISQKPA